MTLHRRKSVPNLGGEALVIESPLKELNAYKNLPDRIGQTEESLANYYTKKLT
jgi:hypothetical protein